MKKTIFGGKRLAMTGALTLCLGMAFAVTLVKRSNAFTLIELVVKFDPVEVLGNQTSHIVFNNTLGGQEIHVEINWGDAISGNVIGTAFQANIAAGHGAIAILPAVQIPGAAANGSRALIGLIRLSPAPGSQSLPRDIASKIGASFEVVDRATGLVTLTQGLSMVPAVQ